MNINTITAEDLRRMPDKEGLILQGCGGDLTEWVDGINEMLTKAGILKDGCQFENVAAFQHGELTCLLYPFDDVKLDIGKLALWRLQTHEVYGGTWLSDFVPNYLGGFIETPEALADKPDCPLIGADGNIFNLLGIASRTLREHGLKEQAMDVWEHIDIQFLKKRNLPVPENYVTEICARSFEEAAQYTIDLLGLQETVEGIIEEWNNMAVEEYSNHVGLLPHALDYLLRLKEHGIKLAVATGLPEKLYIPCLKNNSILELFDALCSTDEVQRGKEYSDVFELAARKLGVAPEHCIVFDDVLPAIKSAKAARMLAGGIYDKYSADQRTEIERIADIYLLDFRQAPIPHKEV